METFDKSNKKKEAEKSVPRVVFSLLTRGIWVCLEWSVLGELQKASEMWHSEHVTAPTWVVSEGPGSF